jgi:oligoendopeptidase F
MSEASTGAIWDLTSFFPEFNGPQMVQFKTLLQRDLDALTRQASDLGTLTPDNSAHWQALMLQAEDLLTRLGHLSSYLGCLESAHADVDAYRVERTALARLFAEVEKLDAVCLKAFKQATEECFQNWCDRPALKPVAYYLRRMRERAQFTMSLPEETLAADLGVDGIKAWERLYNRLTGKLVFEFTNQLGKPEQRPISQWRALMSNEDRSLGRSAFEGGNRAWQSIEEPCAAALNAICGTRLCLYNRRGVKHFLDKPLFQAGINHQTLEAMYTAIHRSIDLPREILRVKAGCMGRKGIWFFEREAPLPLPQPAAPFNWPEAVEAVGSAFDQAYPDLGAFFRKMLDHRWIESQARPNKRPGAFCTDSDLTNEQRVFMTFSNDINSLTTLAHEVGHAWHAHLLSHTRPLARSYPMTLAETASVFAESIFSQGLYRDPGISDSQKLRMLDAELSDAAVMLLDITTRYEFEKAFYEQRAQNELPASQLKALMTATQRRVYGDALLQDGSDPYFWASKQHFYFTGTSFYNFPYTFGFLLTRALIDLFERQGPPFLKQYENFLKRSGSAQVEQVVSSCLGLNIGTTSFWSRSIDSLRPLLEQYRAMIKAMGTDRQ